LNFFELVYEAVRQVPRGRVTTYSAIAKYLGNPRGARAVGWAMRACSDPEIPCHRVIRADGDVGGWSSASGLREKIGLLRREGIQVRKRRVDLSRYYFGAFEFRAIQARKLIDPVNGKTVEPFFDGEPKE
jgi:O-6-methylguanine DNA methyltransferase